MWILEAFCWIIVSIVMKGQSNKKGDIFTHNQDSLFKSSDKNFSASWLSHETINCFLIQKQHDTNRCLLSLFIELRWHLTTITYRGKIFSFCLRETIYYLMIICQKDLIGKTTFKQTDDYICVSLYFVVYFHSISLESKVFKTKQMGSCVI